MTMTTTHDYLGQLRNDWCWRAHSDESARGLTAFRQRHASLALEGICDFGGVVAALETRSTRSVIERARIVEALLVDSRDEMVRRTLLQTLLPGVVSVCRKLRFGDGIVESPSDAVVMAVSLLEELLCDWAGQHRPYAAPDLLSALRGRLRRWLLKEKVACHHDSFDDGGDPEITPSPLLTRLEILRHGPHERLARLTYQCVFVGVPLSELANSDHSSVPSLKRELQVFALAHLLG